MEHSQSNFGLDQCHDCGVRRKQVANPTTNYGFVLPTPTDLVTDLPADFDVALQGVDTRLKALQPGTTLGDLAYSSATANTNTRLAIGSTGNVLTVTGGVPVWAAPAAGGSTLLAQLTSSYGSNYSTTSTSFVDVNASLFALTFTTPASGNIVLRATMPMEFASTGQGLYNWREASSDIADSDFVLASNGGSSPIRGTVAWNCYLTGVTAGSHTYKLGMKTTNSGTTMFGYTNNSRFTLECWSA